MDRLLRGNDRFAARSPAGKARGMGGRVCARECGICNCRFAHALLVPKPQRARPGVAHAPTTSATCRSHTAHASMGPSPSGDLVWGTGFCERGLPSGPASRAAVCLHADGECTVGNTAVQLPGPGLGWEKHIRRQAHVRLRAAAMVHRHRARGHHVGPVPWLAPPARPSDLHVSTTQTRVAGSAPSSAHPRPLGGLARAQAPVCGL